MRKLNPSSSSAFFKLFELAVVERGAWMLAVLIMTLPLLEGMFTAIYRGTITPLRLTILLGVSLFGAVFLLFAIFLDRKIDYYNRQYYEMYEYAAQLRHYAVDNIKALQGAIENPQQADVQPPPESIELLQTSARYLEKSMGSRERNNLLKVILGLAIVAYKYDSKEAKSAVPKELAEDLQNLQLGINLTPETIRGYLKTAASIIDQ